MLNTPRSTSPIWLVIVAAMMTSACAAAPGLANATSASSPQASTTPRISQAPTAKAPASTAPAFTVLAEGESASFAAGRYAFPSRGTNPMIAFTVPSGWAGSSTLVGKDHEGSGPCYPVTCGDAAPFLFPQPLDHGYQDPCTDHSPVVPAAGAGAAGLLRVIAGQPGLDAGPITDVTVGGHDGKYLDYTVTADPTTCGNGEDGFWIWGTCPAPVTVGCEDTTGDRRYGVVQGGRERLYAIDVDGKTYTFFTNEAGDLQAADRAELQQVLDSIEFEPAG